MAFMLMFFYLTKKRMQKTYLFGLILCCFSCNSPELPADLEPSNPIFYQIFIRSFYDSNGDGIGDINGVTEQLDYLENLGVEGLWLLPIHPSPSYHKYDVRDYYDIDSIYGTKADFHRLVEMAHEKGMKVIMDLVLNHSDDEHAWFQSALADTLSPFHDFYNWQQPEVIVEENHLWHAQPADGDVQNESGQKFYGFFWKGMPDLNFDHQPVRDSLIQMSRYWLNEFNVDGFRLDAALHIYPFYVEDRAKNLKKTVAWWQEYGQALRKTHPDLFLVGEIWEGDTVIAPFLQNGLDAGFNFSLSQKIIKVLQDEYDSLGLVNALMEIRKNYEVQNPNFADAIFLTNHDQNRLRSELNDSNEKAKLAASILLTLPGTPFIYYGEELGMLGKKPDELIREPFPWALPGELRGQTTWEAFEYNNPRQTFPLDAQKLDPQSVFQHYKQLIKLRKSVLPLAEGDFEMIDIDNPAVICFKRSFADQEIFVYHNISQKTLDLNFEYGEVVFSSHKQKKGSLLQPLETRILR